MEFYANNAILDVAPALMETRVVLAQMDFHSIL